MTQEEKAKQYDEKLDVARHIYADPSVKDEDKYYIEVIFPELAESEYERIRKEIIKFFEDWTGHTDWVAWLERQGEITKEWSEMKVANIQTELQEMVDSKQKTEQGEQKPVEWSDKNKEMATGILNYLCFSTDATDLDGFNEWYDWLKSITKEGVLPQPKQEWSDVDKDILFRIINDLKFLRDTISTDPKYAVNIINTEREITWLKSLKDRVQPQQQEWSEGDEKMLECALDMIEWYSGKNEDKSRLVSGWLKCLKDKVGCEVNCTTPKEWSEDDERILNQIIKDYEKANESWLKGQGSLPFGNRIKWLKSLRPQKKEALPQWRRLPLNGVSYAPDYWCVMDVITSTVGANSASVSALVKGDYYVPLFELEKFIRNI